MLVESNRCLLDPFDKLVWETVLDKDIINDLQTTFKSSTNFKRFGLLEHRLLSAL